MPPAGALAQVRELHHTDRAWSMSGARRITRRPKGKIEPWHQTLKNHILLENYSARGHASRCHALHRGVASTLFGLHATK